MAAKLGAVLCTLLLLCSCGYIPSGSTEDLLVAPHINERQAEVHAALGVTLNISDIQYKYPLQGEFRSPFILYDMDGDGKQEAVVFYAFRDNPAATRVKVLREAEDGSWHSAYDITGNGDQVDFIAFSKLRDGDGESMLIGWQSARRASTLGVYSFWGDALQEEISQAYTDFMVGDFDNTGRSEIVTIYQDEDGRFQISLLGLGMGGYLRQLDVFPLSLEASHVLQLSQGRLWDNTTGIYTDILLDGSTTATEIVRVQKGSLQPVASSIGGEDISFTFRADDTALCVDLNGDGVMEIPVILPLAGQEDTPEIPALGLMEYMNATEEGFVPVARAVVNEENGYLLYYPEKWVDAVTVVRLPENGEWQFYSLDPDTEEPSTELLRIRVYSTRDYKDQFMNNYELLAESGLLQYYAYIPGTSANHPLALAMEEVKGLFSLLQ